MAAGSLKLRRPRSAPAHAIKPQHSVRHGIPLTDDFAWMKAANWKQVLQNASTLPADIRNALLEENAHARRVMAELGSFVTELTAELRGRIKEDDTSPPEPDGPFLYGTRYRAGGEHPIVWRTPRGGGAEEVLLDGDALAEGTEFFDLDDWTVSPDHTLLAWSSDYKGSEFYTIRIRELSTGKDTECLAKASSETVWGHDGRHFYYCLRDDNARPFRVMRHRLGTPQAADELIHEEDAAGGWFLNIGHTADHSLGLIEIGDADTSEAWTLDLGDARASPSLIQRREPGVEYYVNRAGSDMFIHTNADDAIDFKIMRAPLAAPGRGNWAEYVPHLPGRYISDFTCLKGRLVWAERRDANSRVAVKEIGSGKERVIAPDEPAFRLNFRAGREFDTQTLRISFSSQRRPKEISDYNMATGKQRLLKRDEVPSGHDPDDYVTERLFAVAPDGEAVPVSLLYRRDFARRSNAPLLLEAYGAYGYPTPAEFDPNNFTLVDRGFAYAIAHVRGGAEKGYNWYLDGKLMRKQNTFTDYIVCARHLVASGYTSSGRIVGYGASAGGLLMGAVANLAPELFAAIIAEVPFVDLINTMLDDELPLTPPEWKEWGNPITDPAALEAMLAYSPYENVSAQCYPPILAIGGLTDPRVTYWEPLKWVARIRTVMTGGGPITLKTNMGAGHGGASGRLDRLKEIAVMHAFALAAVGAPRKLLAPPKVVSTA